MFRFGDEKGQLKCSFCGKSQEQVRKLIAGPGVYICDECIELCNEIIEEELYKNVDENLRLRNIPKPKEINHILNQYVIGQERAKKVARGRGLQPLQARERRRQRRRRRAAEVQHLTGRADRLGQDLSRPDAGEDSGRAARDGRCDLADRGRLRRRRRREHSAQAHPGRGLRRQARRKGHRLHRRDRQDRSQEREPVDHARRVGRRRAAGAAQDPRRHDRQRPAAGRAQAPASRVHPNRHDQRAVHLRRRFRRPGEDHREPGGSNSLGFRSTPEAKRSSKSGSCCSN